MWNLHEWMTSFHVASGTVALVGGTIALAASKGPGIHARAGRVFAWAMILPIVTTLFFMFEDLRPLAIFLSVAVIYFLGSAIMAIRNRSALAPYVERALLVIPIGIALFAMLRVVRSLTVTKVLVDVPGPLLFVVLFGGLAYSDLRLLRSRPTQRNVWIRRHLLRMLLAFAFATMALLRIGLKLGVPLVVTVAIPIGLALVASVFFSRRLETVAPAPHGN